MDIKTKELIAIGASVTAHCVPCLQFHFKKAHESGATSKEIQEAIAVGRRVRKGAAETWEEAAAVLLQEEGGAEQSDAGRACGTT